MHIAQDFLICTNEEDTYIIMLTLPHIVERDVACLVSVVNIADNFSVAIAGDILNRSRLRRPLVEMGNRHNGENLINGPGIGKRLKEREVAEIFVCHSLVDIA